VSLQQIDIWNLNADGMQLLCRHNSVSSAVEPLWFLLFCPNMTRLKVGPPVGDPNRFDHCCISRWTLQYTHFHHH